MVGKIGRGGQSLFLGDLPASIGEKSIFPIMVVESELPV
jgi:hypothetical protein